MKNIFKLTVLLLSITLTAQDYDKWSIGAEIGATKIRDVSRVLPYNTQLNLRYMPNTLFGAQLSGGYTNINEEPIDRDYRFYNASLHGVINVGRLLEFESFTKHYTILTGVGGTYTESNNPTNQQILHRLSNFHLSAFVDNEFKLSNSIFLTLGLDVITGVNSRPFTNGINTETTSILNFNTGITIALGKEKEHADWYIEEYIAQNDTIFLKPTIIDKTITKREIYSVKSNNIEYVFFDNDSYTVEKQGLNAIVKSTDKLVGSQTITVIGYASPPASDDYNLKLSKRRAEAVVDKLISIGIMESQIKLLYKGEINTTNDKNIDLARRVALIVK